MSAVFQHIFFYRYGYKKPCVLDIKIGTSPASPDSSECKIKRHYEKAKTSTGFSLGLRFTGMQKMNENSSLRFIYNLSDSIHDRSSFLFALRIFFIEENHVASKNFNENMVIASFDDVKIDGFQKYDFQKDIVVISVKNQVEALLAFLSSKQRNESAKKFNFYSSSLLTVYERGVGGLLPIVRIIDLQHVFEKKPGSIVENDDDGVLFGLNELMKLLNEL